MHIRKIFTKLFLIVSNLHIDIKSHHHKKKEDMFKGKDKNHVTVKFNRLNKCINTFLIIETF